MSEHAEFSPSSFDRLFVCTASYALTKDLPNETSEYAERGTRLHAIAEGILKGELTEDDIPEGEHDLLDYVNYVQALGGQQWYEQRLHLNGDVWGTADAIVLNGSTLHVVDLKAGQGVAVSALSNPQLMTYGLMAYQRFAEFNEINTIAVHIVQPWLNSTSTDSFTVEQIMRHKEQVLGVVDRAKRAEELPVPSEKGCKFCKVRATCTARARVALDMARHDFMPPALLSADDLGEVLAKASQVQAWVKDVQDYALEQAVKGQEVRGYKLVAGRTTRKITDTEVLAQRLLASGLTETEIYERSLLTLTRLEKLVGKKPFADLCEGLVDKSPAKPVLVPADDKRPSIAQSDFM